MQPNAEVDWPNVGLDQKLKGSVLEAPKAVFKEQKVGVLGAPNAGALEAPKVGLIENAGIVVEPKAEVTLAPNAGEVVELKEGVLIVGDRGRLTPKAVPVIPIAELAVEPKVGGVVAFNTELLEAPTTESVVEPNGVLKGNACGRDVPRGMEEPNDGCEC